MASEPIHIHDDSELSRLFDEAAEHPVTVKRKGRVYRLAVVDETGDTGEWDQGAFLEALHDVTGIISEEEGEEMIRKIYEYRRIGSRPIWRP